MFPSLLNFLVLNFQIFNFQNFSFDFQENLLKILIMSVGDPLAFSPFKLAKITIS